MAGEPTTAAWLEHQLERALERIEALTRDVARTQSALATREQEIDDLRQSLAVLDGRTRRQEAAQDALPDIRRAVATIEERLAAESALRRDQLAATERGHDREDGTAHLMEREVIELDRRIATIEQALRAAGDRDARLDAALSDATVGSAQTAARVEALRAQTDALTLAARRDTGDFEQLREALDAAQQHIGAVEARTDVMLRDLQLLKDEMLVVRRALDRETTLTDLVEQLRVLRLRLEEGLAALDQRLDAETAATRADSEATALARARLASIDQAVAEIAARVESQRLVLLDHFQRVTTSAEDAGRRQTEEIDRQVRAARELLVRLAESADETTREQPL